MCVVDNHSEANETEDGDREPTRRGPWGDDRDIGSPHGQDFLLFMELPIHSTYGVLLGFADRTHRLSIVPPKLHVLPPTGGAQLLGHVGQAGVVGELGVVVFMQRGCQRSRVDGCGSFCRRDVCVVPDMDGSPRLEGCTSSDGEGGGHGVQDLDSEALGQLTA